MNGQPDKKGSIDSSISGLYSLLTDEKAMNGDVFPGSMETLASDTQRAEVRQGLYRKLHGRGIFTGSYEDFDNYFFNPYSQGNQVATLRNKTFTRDPAKEMARNRALMDASKGEYNPYGTSEVSYRPEVRGLGTNIAPIDLVDSEDTLPEPKTPAGDRPKTTRTFWGGVVSGARGIHGGAQIAVAELLKMFGGGDSDDEKEAIHLINQMEKDGTLSIDTIREMRKKLGTRIATYTPAGFIYTPPSGKIARQLDALNLIEERMQRMGKDLSPEKRAVALDAMRSDLSEKGASEDKANHFVRWKEDAKDYIRKSEVPEGTWAELGSATASVGGALAGQAISMIPGAAPVGQAISWASIGAQTISSGGQAIMDMEDYAAEKGVYITPEEKATIALGYMAAEFGGDALGGAVASKSISAIGKLAGGRIGQKLAVRSLAKGIAGNEGVRQSLSSLSEYAQKPLTIPLAKSAGRQIVRGAVTEGPGESLTTLAQNGALDRVWKDKEDQEAWADVARQAVKDGIYGAWAGALMGGFGSAIQSGQVAHMHRKEGLTIVQDAKNNLYEVIGADQSSYLVLDQAGRQKMLPADQVVDAIHYTPEERQKSQKAYDDATEGLHPKEGVLTENQKRAGAILSATEQQQSPIYRATHPEVAEEELNSPVALAGAKKALADVLEGQNEEVRARVDQMALVLRDGETDPTEELTKLFSDESLSDNDRQSILDVVTAQSRLIALERSHQEAMARMQSELTKEWSAKSVVGDESARGAVISATMTDADGKPKQVYVTGGVRVMTNEDGTVELLPTDDGAPIYVYDESVDGEEKGHIVQMDDLSSPQLVAEDYLDLVQAAVDEADAAFLNEVQQAEEQASQSEEGDAGDTTDDFMQSLPRTREGEVDGLRLMSERPDDFIRYLGQLYGEDFVASLPLSKKGGLDLKALTPEQTLRVNEAALGKSGAVEAARQRRSQVGAERAKLEGEVKNDLGNLEKRMALRKASEEYRLYDDYVRTAEEQARQEREAQKRAEEAALTPEERQRREEEKRQLAQEKKEREERIRLENERRRREREELERNAEGSTVREYTEDPPRQARTRGARLVNGAVVYRQEPMTVEHYADAERAFSQRPGETRVPVKRTIVEAESLQASHKEGRMNPKHFIPEAQPKDRADNGLSSTAADRIASDIRPDEITGGITAYTGAPVVNGRGEVIQGNNRTDALQTMYDGAERHAKSAERYKEYLKAHASDYGMTAEQVDAIAHPVAVDLAEVSDSEAIRLGHRGQTDLESAGTDTMNAQTVGEELNSDTDPQSGQSMLVSFFNRIFNRTGANGAELSAKMDNMLNRNAEEGLKFLHENGYITDTQYKNAFETNSEGKRVVTAEAKTALKDVALYQLADVIGPRAMDIFYRLPASARNGLATFLYRDSQASFETSLAPDLGDALLVWDSLRQDPDFAGLTNFESAKIFILGKVSLFGRSELETNLGEASSLAKLLAASLQTQTEEQIANVLNQYYDLVGANETGAKMQSLMPTSQPTDTKAGAAEAVYGRVYEVPSGREKHYRFRRDVPEDFRARRDALADRITEERRKYAAAMDMARTLGVPLKLHEDMSTLPEEVRAGFDETHFVKGWFYKGDNAVHIYLPANVDADDVRATFLHEAVGHYGCRELLGEVGYNQVLDKLANKLGEEEVLRAMSEYCNGSQDLTDLGQVRIAMDEWIAHRAESGITKKTVWESIKDFFRKVFGLSGKQIDQSAEMMADDLLRRSAENLQKRAERQQGVATEEAEVKSGVRFRARKANGEEVDLPGVSYSDVRDHRGHRFVKASDGSIDFGEIREETGLTPGKIRLSEGFQSEYAGYGLLHMERPERKEQILKAGFSSAVNFAEYVAKNYTAIFRGKDRENGKPTYILQAPTSKSNILYVELSPEEGYWDINSGGPFSFTYTKNKEIVWSLPALGHTLVTGGMEFSAQQTGDRQSGNSPQTISLDDKGTESSVYNKKDESEKRFRRAERAGDVSGAAEAVSDFMRNATPKNTSVDDVLRFLRVYHNSPHLLKKADGSFVDPETGERLGFDHRFMGSGEGAQAHGWGSYFSVKDLADYATPSADVFNGMHIMENEAYVTSKGGSTNTAFILFLSIRDCCMKSSSTLNEKIVKKAVKEDLEERIQLTELYARREGRLLEALKDNEPWAVAATSNVLGGTIIDPKTGYKYQTHPDYSVDKVRLTYKGFQRSVDGYKDVLSFTENNPDYVKYFVEKAARHKYSVEIPDPSVYEYINEREPLSDRATDLLFKAMREDPLPLGKLDPREVYGVSGGDIYRSIARKFQLHGDPSQKTHIGSSRAASEWLSRAGIVGIHYIGRVDGECYVIFNEKDAKITEHIRFRRTERTDPKSMSDPINPQWDGEWYSSEDLTGKSTADLLDLPAAPATPEKLPTQSVASSAETMSRHYADPRVRFRTGAHKENLRAPQPPRITDGMSLYEVAQLQHEYNRNYRDYLSSSMKRMDALVTTNGRFIRYMVDSARPVELFCKEMERMGIGMTPERNIYQDMMTQSSRELNMRKQEVEPLVTKLTDRIRDLREQKLLDKVMDVSYTFTDEDTNETKTIKRADGYDKVSLYFQAKDIVECEQLGLVSRGREGFEKVVTEFGKSSNHITPEAYIASFEASVGKANAEALCDNMRKMSRWSIDRLHGAGLMTDDQYRSLTQSPRRYYAPQRGFKITEESDRNAYERVEMTAEGRQSLSGDPIAYMQAIMNTTVMRVVRNRDLLHLYEWVTQHQQELARRGVLEIGETYYRKSGVDEKGNPIYMPSKQAPTIEELRHDTDVRRQVAKLRMEQKRLDQSHDKGETADYVYGIKSKEISNKISDLNNSIEILYRDPTPLRGDSREQEETSRRTVKVYKDGVEQQIHFSPQYRGELVADVLNGRPSMDQDTRFYRSVGRYIEKAGAINFVSKATRFMSALMTQYNPNFAVTNALRDYGTALISNVSDFGWAYQRDFMANYAKVQKTVLKYAMSDAYSDGTYPSGKYGTYLKEFFDEGAATGWSFLPDVVKIRQTMKEMSDPSLKQKFVNGKYGVANAFGLKQGIGMLTEASELNTRFAEYVTSRERGYSSKEAAKHAKELTVNFNRKGTLAGVFGSFFGFWNASIQGTNKIVRLGKHGAEWCGTLFAGGLAQGLLYALSAPDKDDERAFTEWEMMTNLCMGDVKIPLPQGFRGFWGAGVQMALAIAGKKDWQGSVIDGMQYLVGELLPNEAAALSNIVEWDDVTGNVKLNSKKVLRDVVPTAIQPEMDVILNMDFMGNPVYREPFIKSQEGQIAQRTLGKKRTKKVYKDLSDKIWYAMGGSLERNDLMSRDETHILPDDVWLNPSVIEHVFEGRTTGVGKTLADIATCVSAASNGDPSELRKLQIVNVLTKQEKDYSDSDRSYWKLMDFYRSRQQTMSNLRKAKEGKDLERYKEMTRRASELAPRMTGEQLTEKIWEDGTKDEKLYVTWLETKALLKQIDKGTVTKEEVAPTIDRLTEQFRELR